MDNVPAQRCQKNSVLAITDYQAWTNAVKLEDRLLRQDLENARSVSLGVSATTSGPQARALSVSSTQLVSPSSTPSSTGPRLPDEKRILSEHDGCFKCRRSYAGHRTCECPNGFPEKYERVTTAKAEVVRDGRNRLDGSQRDVAAVAAVLGPLRLDDGLPGAVLGSGSEESDDYSDRVFLHLVSSRLFAWPFSDECYLPLVKSAVPHFALENWLYQDHLPDDSLTLPGWENAFVRVK